MGKFSSFHNVEECLLLSFGSNCARTHMSYLSFNFIACSINICLDRKHSWNFADSFFTQQKRGEKKHKEWTKLWGILLFAFIWYGCVHHGAIVLAIFHKIWKYMKSLWFFFWPKWNGMIFLALMRSNAAEWTFSSKNVEMKTTK